MNKHRGNENKQYIEAMREIRKSNKAGTHQDKRDKRCRTRSDKLRKSNKGERIMGAMRAMDIADNFDLEQGIRCSLTN